MNLIKSQEWLKNPRIVCGIMTGTSLDGVDVAIARFEKGKTRHKMEILDYSTFPFPNLLKSKILKSIEQPVPISLIAELNFELAGLYKNSIEELQQSIKLNKIETDAIGIHGQTVWHEPNGTIPNTLQIGSGSVLANLTNKTVVSDFRSADVALGGQGAPLVPIFDYSFLRSKKINRVALNIGGISNITYLPKGCEENAVIAFDTGPGNVWIDSAMKILFNQGYDNNGDTASKGKLNMILLEKLKSIEYTYLKPPKSIGRELFSTEYLINIIDEIKQYIDNNEDIINTITYFTAWSIALNIKEFASAESEIIISGGGAENKTLVNFLKKELPNSNILKSDDIGIPSEAKEAIAFAYLTWRTIGGMHGNICSVTGAIRPAILGSISIV